MIYFERDYTCDSADLNYPRVLWDNICPRGTVAASTSAEGRAAVNAATATTFDRWEPTTLPAWWKLTFTEEAINAVAIDTHTIGSTGSSIALQEWNGSAWVDVVPAVSPADDEPIAFLFAKRETDRIRVYITGSEAPTIAVVHCSSSLVLPQKVYMGVATPVDLAQQTEFDTTRSANGAYLGRSVLRKKNTNDFQVEHLTERFVREAVMPFINSARETPYFLLERPYQFPASLSYRWRDDDITPERMGVRSFMKVTI